MAGSEQKGPCACMDNTPTRTAAGAAMLAGSLQSDTPRNNLGSVRATLLTSLRPRATMERTV